MAEELLSKETIGLTDIVRVLGPRPFDMKENVKEYLQDMEDRNQQDKEAADS